MSVGLVQVLIIVALVVLFFAPKKVGKWGGSVGKAVGGKRKAKSESDDFEEDDTVSKAVKAAKMARKLHKASRGGFPWN